LICLKCVKSEVYCLIGLHFFRSKFNILLVDALQELVEHGHEGL